jgi:hypothetical protein
MSPVADPMLMCLVYVSAAARPFSDEDLVALLRQSRGNNERSGITGLLLYHDGKFMQALEGEQQAVQALFRRIQVDPRHRNVTVLIKFAIPDRYFSDWSMGFVNIDRFETEDRAGFSPFLEKSLDDRSFVDAPHQAVRLLQRFKEIMI